MEVSESQSPIREVTRKEYVFVSCSEDSNDNDVDPKDICHVMILPDVDENMVDRNEVHFWTRRSTLLLLELYKVYRPQVGMSKIKTIKKMFEIISAELSARLCHKVSPAHCENRWKVLERGYRKFVDNAHKSGRGRKDFEFADIMSEILGGKKSIIPKPLTSLVTEDHLAEHDPQERITNHKVDDVPRDNDNRNSWATKERATRSATYILQALKHERKQFFKKKLELQEKKLQEKMKYMEKKLKLEEMKVVEERRRSETLQQSNILLREIIDILKER
ncbi:hypothetical protein J437_LFUL019445 [Ladona fulva]|uniref:Myb/SANT-like DNA-binding domain-containing protein n=1 Tax=Ladona fulva TaxID=123851 RepID=A0A8K0KQU3_LADFU|nr:hypothetical protein J437_LFUL019445 [Ladona fulva]